jgi:Type VI secretion system effector, Hcp
LALASGLLFRAPMMKTAAILALALAASAPVAAQAQGQVGQQGPQLEYEAVIEGLGKAPVIVPVESWSWGASADSYGNRNGSGINMQDLHLVIEQSKESAQMLELMLAKKELSRVEIRVKQPSSHTFELVMRNVSIGSFQTGGSGGYGRGSGPMEQMSLSFKTAKMTVKTPKGAYSTDIKP